MNAVLLLMFGCMAAAVGQTDSVATPSALRFAPSIRTFAAEASTFLLYFGSFGGTADLDLLEVPLPSLQRAGLRVTYQEFRRGFIFDPGRSGQVAAYSTSVFLRGSYRRGNTRSDALLGVSTNDPRGNHPSTQFLLGLDLRTLVVRPVAAIFVRIMGNPNGASVQFGLAVGYME